MTERWHDNLRVHYGESSAPLAMARERTPAQKAQDDILDKAEAAALEAINKAQEAIEWLSIVTPVKARTAPVFLRQLHAEIVELRRVRQ